MQQPAEQGLKTCFGAWVGQTDVCMWKNWNESEFLLWRRGGRARSCEGRLCAWFGPFSKNEFWCEPKKSLPSFFFSRKKFKNKNGTTDTVLRVRLHDRLLSRIPSLSVLEPLCFFSHILLLLLVFFYLFQKTSSSLYRYVLESNTRGREIHNYRAYKSFLPWRTSRVPLRPPNPKIHTWIRQLSKFGRLI